MTQQLDIIKQSFESDLSRVVGLLKLIDTFRNFGASAPPTTKNPADSWSEAHSLHSDAGNRRTDLPLFSGSLLLYMAGRFEYCVKQIVEAVADDIVNKSTKYDDLSDQIKKTLKQKTLEIAQNPKKYGYDISSSEVFLENLINNIQGKNTPLVVKSEIISITDSNMRPTIMNDILKIVGIKDFWKEIGKQNTIKIHLDKSKDEDAMMEAKARLEFIMDERNSIAHPTVNTTFPDTNKMLEIAEFLKILIQNTHDLAKINTSCSVS